MPNVERGDHRKKEAIADRAEREVPRRIEAGGERRRNEVGKPRDEGPNRGFLQRESLVRVYDFFFPCSS
jgi:hypothetical protein